MESKFFTQCVCVLLKSPVSIKTIQQTLSDLNFTGEDFSTESWEFCGSAAVAEYQPESDSHLVIDVIEQAWPDDMDYDTPDSLLHAAWKTGNFGAHTFPGALERAIEQSWVWPEGKEIAPTHTGFIRLRISYAFGESDADAEGEDEESDIVLPDDYDPVNELEFLVEQAGKLLALPQALCYFNASGEVLRDRGSFGESVQLCEEHEVPPIDLWSNIRLFRFDDDWAMMDSVGNGQLGLDDVETCFHSEGYDFNTVDQLIRMVSMLSMGGEEFEEGESVEDESGQSWTVSFHEDSLCDPPRYVLRLVPDDGRELPPQLSEAPE
ncbi:MAG: DUF4261 domain-containing protein [Pirellula sp.]